VVVDAGIVYPGIVNGKIPRLRSWFNVFNSGGIISQFYEVVKIKTGIVWSLFATS